MFSRYYLVFSFGFEEKKRIYKWQFVHLKNLYKSHKKITQNTFEKIGIFLERVDLDHLIGIREEHDSLTKKQRQKLYPPHNDEDDQDI